MLNTIVRSSFHRAETLLDTIHPSGAPRRRSAKLARYYRWWAARTDQRADRCRQQGIIDAADMYVREAHNLREAADMLDHGATEQDVERLIPPPF